MNIKELDQRADLEQDKTLTRQYANFEKLIFEIKKKEIPADVVNQVNQNIDEINSFSGSNKELRAQMRKSQSRILNLLEKKLKLVPKNYYRNRWMAIGMTVFGIPLGAAFGAGSGNTSSIAIGIPVGMVIGLAIGSGMDKKAFEEGKQLDLETK